MQAFRPSDTVFMSTVQNTSTLKNRNLSQNIKFENDGSEFKKNRGSKLSLTRALSRA